VNMWNDDGDVRIWPFHQACSFIMSIKEERWWETKDEMMMLKKVDKRGQFSCKFQTLILFYSVVTFIFFRFFFFHTLMNVGVKSTKFEEGRRRRIFSFMFLLYEREWGMKRKSKKKRTETWTKKSCWNHWNGRKQDETNWMTIFIWDSI
jgi:hypothetical protein